MLEIRQEGTPDVPRSQEAKKKKKTVAPNRFNGILHVFPDEVSLFQAFR